MLDSSPVRPTKSGYLYVVALPIGNPLDISDRAKQILEQVDIVAAEDTRNLGLLAKQLCLKIKRTLSYHQHNERESAAGLIDSLLAGQNIAVVSDAGTPNISDPGFSLLKECFARGIAVCGIPGASALSLSLSINPLGGTDHYFGAFLPKVSSERQQKLQSLRQMANFCSKAVFFESPHRLVGSLQDIELALDNPTVFLCRELTKNFETLYLGKASELLARFCQEEIRGEIVLCIDLTAVQQEESLAPGDLRQQIRSLLKQGLSSKQIQKRLQANSGLTTKDLYQQIIEEKEAASS